jgi:1,4-dihydroxy-2-naphthoate octaprenyltransferase
MDISAPSWRLWLAAARPRTLPASVSPVVVGGAVAWSEGGFHLAAMLTCLFFALIMQIGANLANDYFDWKNHVDGSERLGPKRFCQSGLIAPARMRRAVSLTFLVAALLLVFLVARGGWPIVALGLAAIAAAPAYSGGPYPLAAHGLGEAAAFVFFGLVAVGGSAFIIGGYYGWLAFIAAIPPGLLIAALMLVNNYRDMPTDNKAGRRTLVIILGRDKSVFVYWALLTSSYLLPAAMTPQRGPLLCLPLLTLPLAWRLGQRLAVWQGEMLNGLLAATARLALLHSLFFAAGIAFS